MYQCNFHKVKSLKAFLPPEKIVPDCEQQQKLHYYAISKDSLYECVSQQQRLLYWKGWIVVNTEQDTTDKCFD